MVNPNLKRDRDIFYHCTYGLSFNIFSVKYDISPSRCQQIYQKQLRILKRYATSRGIDISHICTVSDARRNKQQIVLALYDFHLWGDK